MDIFEFKDYYKVVELLSQYDQRFLGSTLRHPYQILATFIPTPHSCELKYMSNRNRVKFVSQIYTPDRGGGAAGLFALRSPLPLLKRTKVVRSKTPNMKNSQLRQRQVDQKTT